MPRKKLAIEGGTPAIAQPLPGGGLGTSMIDEQEIEAIAGVLRSKKLFRYDTGSNCQAFEKEICEWLGVKHAVLVNSGTSALTCALSGLAIGPGDEVIVPAYTYIATAAAVVGVGAVPVIAEIDDSLGLDPDDVRKKITPHTRAILPVHMQGIPCRLSELWAIAKEHNLVVVEDCCQAIGSSYKGKATGSLSDAGAWSINLFKVITTGEGGVFFTNDDDVLEKALFHSEPALPMWLDRKDWNSPPYSRSCYRGNEILSAMGRVQLRKLPAIVEHCRKLKKLLLAGLNEPLCYKLQHVDDPSGEIGISFCMIARTHQLAKDMGQAIAAEGLRIGTAYNKDGFPDRHIFSYWDSILNKNGATPAGYPWKDPAYKGNVQYSKDMCPNTLDILSRSLRFGLHMGLQEEHMIQIAEAINKVDAAFAEKQV